MEYVKFAVKLTYQSLLTNPGPFLTDYPSLVGQKWIVTGATGGIGLEIAKVLAKQGAELWIVGRNVEKLNAVKQQLGGSVHIVVIDYKDLATVKPAVEKIKQETDHFDGIIHNAGVMMVPRDSVTVQGLEETVGVNNVATQYLQNELDPLIVNVPKGRIVWLSSLAHALAPKDGFDLRVLAGGNTSTIYAMSKAWDYFQALAWTRNHPASTVKSIAVHPGVIKSDLMRTCSRFEKLMMVAISYDTPVGALAPLYAALYPDVENNDYIIPYGRPGIVRPDIYRAARGESGEAAVAWINEQIKKFEASH